MPRLTQSRQRCASLEKKFHFSFMDWKNLRDQIYYLDGSWRDIYIHNTTKEDWQLWADFVKRKYKTSFYIYETDDRPDKVDLAKIFDYWAGVNDNGSTATVFVDKIRVNTHFFTEKEIENDIDPKAINSIDDHNKLVDYMKALSKLLNKQVILTPENQPEFILIFVDNDSIKVNI
jgi:hypothetical protein